MTTRNTSQRERALRVFETATRPIDPHELVALANRHTKILSIATAHRAVKAMHESGYLRRVEVPGRITLYERAELPPNAHFHCVKCDRVFCVEECATPKPPRACTLESWLMLMRGVCKDCQK